MSLGVDELEAKAPGPVRPPRREGVTVPRSRPTIGQVLHTLGVGGAEVLAARLARQLGGAYRFVFFCLDGLGTLGEELRAEGFPVRVLGRRPGLDGRCAWHLGGLLRREHVDLLHAHQYTPFFYALMSRFLYRNTPVLFTEHGRHAPDYPRRKRILANRLLLRRRDRVVGVGEAVRQALITNEGISPARVGVIYNGVHLAPFASPGDSRGTVRRELGCGPGDLVIIQVARLDYLKDHATALRAFAEVLRHRPDARLLLVGEGPEHAAMEAESLRLGLGAHVRLLGLRKDVARLLFAADLFLLTSISEGIPLTVIEAMAAGLPVVSTRVGGVAEVVEEGRTGLLAPSGDARALAGKVARLAGDAALRRRMGDAGRDRARALFSEPLMHTRYQRLYREMLGE
jgi:glycosyltransferase involved in cell wall biosynthesis